MVDRQNWAYFESRISKLELEDNLELATDLPALIAISSVAASAGMS